MKLDRKHRVLLILAAICVCLFPMGSIASACQHGGPIGGSLDGSLGSQSFSSLIISGSGVTPGGQGWTVVSAGDHLSFPSSVGLTQNSIEIHNSSAASLFSLGTISWAGAGKINLSFDFTATSGSSVTWGTLGNFFTTKASDADGKLHHFSSTFSLDGLSKNLFITALAGGNGAVFVGNAQASAVPIPAASLLFGSGLLGLIGFKRKLLG